MTRLDLQDKDPNHGTLSIANETIAADSDTQILESLGQSSEQQEKILKSYKQGHPHCRQATYIHCWRMLGDEDRTMWKHMVPDGQGVVIKTTIKRLKQALGITNFPGKAIGSDNVQLSLEVVKVPYTSEETPSPLLAGNFAITRKQANALFLNEKEITVQACMSIDAFHHAYHCQNRKPPLYQKVPIDLERLFEAVFVSSSVSEDQYARIESEINLIAKSRVARRSVITR
jgi:hypothetical protein